MDGDWTSSLGSLFGKGRRAIGHRRDGEKTRAFFWTLYLELIDSLRSAVVAGGLLFAFVRRHATGRRCRRRSTTARSGR
jgi:hypothetical protein